MKSLLKVLAGLALSALTFWLFLRNLDLVKVREGLEGANLPLLVLAIVVGYFGHLGLRARRWATMLRPLKRDVAFYNLFSTTAIGYAVSWLAPGRIGEVVRPVLLARREGIPPASCIATVGVERVIDAATVLVLAAIAGVLAPVWAPGSREPVLRAAPMFGLAALVACAVGYLIARSLVREGSPLMRALDRRAAESRGTRGRIWSFARNLAAGAAFLRDARRSLRVGVESVGVWLVIAISIWLGLAAAGVWIPFVGVFLLMALAVIGIAVPTPGGAGPVHFAFQQGLIGLFGIEANRASVATVLYHPVLTYVPPVVFGLAFAWRDGLTLGRLRALAKQSPNPPAEAPGRDGAEGGLASTPRGLP